MPDDELRMTFDPQTIEHLGVRMYSTLPPVLAELIGNAHDADAEHVALTFKDTGAEKEIVIEDDGAGMSFDEINEKFLRIGRNRRAEDMAQTTQKGRKIIGKKGLGKLSFFGIAHEIEIITRKDGKENVFSMSWEAIKTAVGEYRPTVLKNNEDCSTDNHGMTIILRKIQRESAFSPEDIANNIAKMFIIDSDFEVTVRHNAEEPITVTNERRYAGLDKDVEWKVPDDIGSGDDYDKASQIRGHLIATKKPIPPNSNMRGIILFSRKKLVNNPEYFSDSTSSHFFSYLTGWLEVDFIDDLDEDVISTNRASLIWEHPEMQELRMHLRGTVNWLERDWRRKREEKRDKELKEATGINIPDWLAKLPVEIRTSVKPIVEKIAKEAELPVETHLETIKKLHEIVPEYPTYHWRHLHEEIRAASETDYQNGDYYRAFQEAAKRYINAVKTKSGSANSSERGMMGEVFGIKLNTSSLLVARTFKKPDGTDFQKLTIENIEDGQQLLSMGVVCGCRNPVSHEEVCDLRDSGLFTEKDCLDALSLLSHLFKRLDESESPLNQHPTVTTILLRITEEL